MRSIISKLRQPQYNGVLDDMIDFTGMNAEEIIRRKSRSKQCLLNEFVMFTPKTQREYEAYYKVSSVYLFHNLDRPYWNKLDLLDVEIHDKVLDFGGGNGCNAIPLSERGFDVYYYDINELQKAFVEFRYIKRELQGYVVLNSLDTSSIFYGKYDAIILQDVLEHLPNYECILRKLIGMLRSGGLIFEVTKFLTSDGRGHPHHLPEKKPLEQIMKECGMKEYQRFSKLSAVWIKN